MTSISKNLYIDKLDYIVNEYNSTFHNTIKIIDVLTSTDVKSSTYIGSSQEVNDKDPKSKIGEIFRVSKYKNIFVKGYTKNWSKEDFLIKKFKYCVMKLCYQ